MKSVVVNGIIYIGGGNESGDVMEFDPQTESWVKLLDHKAFRFGMADIEGKLVLVGGSSKEDGESDIGYYKSLSVWDADRKELAEDLYPDMPIPRSGPSVVTYKEWMIVAGGNNPKSLCSVDVMNISTKQWYTGPPAHSPFKDMRVAKVNDMCYFLGGSAKDDCNTMNAYRVSLPALISQVKSENNDVQIWESISPLKICRSSPLSINGSLYAFGGFPPDPYSDNQTEIYRYLPDSDEWVVCGHLPNPREDGTSAVLPSGEIVFTGGIEITAGAGDSYFYGSLCKKLSSTDIATVVSQ